jgi:hypothetical protein
MSVVRPPLVCTQLSVVRPPAACTQLSVVRPPLACTQLSVVRRPAVCTQLFVVRLPAVRTQSFAQLRNFARHPSPCSQEPPPDDVSPPEHRIRLTCSLVNLSISVSVHQAIFSFSFRIFHETCKAFISMRATFSYRVRVWSMLILYLYLCDRQVLVSSFCGDVHAVLQFVTWLFAPYGGPRCRLPAVNSVLVTISVSPDAAVCSSEA